MSSFEVIGGRKLKGEIIPQGAKNEALQVISAVLLTDQKVTITNIPDILDVNNLIELLRAMNVKIDRPDRHTCTFQADDVDLNVLRSSEFKSKSGMLRGSVMLAGPMLGRYKKAFIPKPGGDKIGRRRLDTHILGFEKLGAEMIYYAEDAFYHFTTAELNVFAWFVLCIHCNSRPQNKSAKEDLLHTIGFDLQRKYKRHNGLSPIVCAKPLFKSMN